MHCIVLVTDLYYLLFWLFSVLRLLYALISFISPACLLRSKLRLCWERVENLACYILLRLLYNSPLVSVKQPSRGLALQCSSFIH